MSPVQKPELEQAQESQEGQEMKREILCKACAAYQVPMHPLDVLNGFHRRIVPLQVKKPEGHGVRITQGDATTFHEMSSICCDHCDEPISDGSQAVAVTWWNEHREGEPGAWEKDYQFK